MGFELYGTLPSSMQLDSVITSCMGGAPRTNKSYFSLLHVIFATFFLFSGFGLETRDWSELPGSVVREHFKLLICVHNVFCKFFIKKGSVMTKFTTKSLLLDLLGRKVYIGIHTQQWVPLVLEFYFISFYFSLSSDIDIS